MRRTVVAVALLLAAAGCSGVDDGAVRDLEDMPGVGSVHSSCTMWVDCRVHVDVEPDVTAELLGPIISTSRDTGSREIQISIPTTERDVSLETTAESAEPYDRATAELMVAAAADDALSGATIARTEHRSGLTLHGDGSRAELWASAGRLWRVAESIDADELEVSGSADAADGEGPTMLTAESFPQEATNLVLALDEESTTPWGVRIEGREVVLGALSLDAAEQIEGALGDVGVDDSGLSVRVEVTRGMPGRPSGAPQPTSGGTDEQRRAVLAAFGDLGVRASVEETTVEVDVGVQTPDELRRVVSEVRATLPAQTGVVPIRVVLDFDEEVDLGVAGDPALVGLAAELGAELDVATLGIRHEEPDQDVEPVRDTATSMGLRVMAPDLSTGFSDVAEVVAQNGDVSSMVVSVTAEDAEGREPSATLRVDRRDDGSWRVRGTEHQTAERIAEASTAWQDGVSRVDRRRSGDR